jgi:hypothetical protein
MAGINHIRRWVMSQMTKKADDGIMITLPDSKKVDLNVSITMDRLLRNGIDPDAFTNPEQVNNAINMINSRMVSRAIPADSAEGREITEKLFGKQKAPVFDLEGNRIPEGSGIMGGKSIKSLMDSGQVRKGARGMKKSKKVQDREMFQKSNLNKTEAQLKAEMEASNKKGIAGIKNKRQLTEDEYQDFLDEVGGADQLEAYNFDGTVGDAKRIIKEQKDYMSQMEMEFRKGKLDPEPGSRTPQRKRFLQKKLEEAEASGDARLLSREEREELFDLDDIPEYATGGRAGFMAGGMGRRGFLKMLAGLGGGIAAAKTGLLKFAGKEPAKQVAKEVVQKSTTTPPPYFFKLAEKIKMLGDDATATTDRTIAKTLKSKDGKSTYVLEEDVTTGDTIIKKVNKEGDEMITDVEIMEFKKGEVVQGRDGKALKTPDQYEEVTEANARIEGDVFNDPYYTDGIQIDDIMKEVGEQAPSIKKADGGIMRAGYQMGGDVAYDATNKDIYGSSAATFTPDTVMDQFGNQVQSEMGNDFNKPLIPQVTEEAANGPKYRRLFSPRIPGTSPIANASKPPPETPVSMQTPLAGSGGISEIDIPVAGGNNNAGGILPVESQLSEFRDDTPTKMPGGPPPTQPNMSDEDIMKGFAEYKRQNPGMMGLGTQAIVNLTLPGGTPMTFPGGAEAAALRQYLRSIGMEAGPGKGMGVPLKKAVQPGGTLAALASGGIARMLGE